MTLVTPDIQQLIDNAKNIVFLTGAGVSTASGIPDYRSKGGIYDGIALRPEYLLSTEALASEPEKMYEFAKENMYFPAAQPNIIHEKMATLTQKNRARIITQNVDGLHLKAGAKNVIEFHGSLYNIYSTTDGKPSDVDAYLQSPYREDGALLRPAITLYGEIPFRVDEAAQWMTQADLVVIVGTSFVVYPFAGLLQYARPNVPVLAVNLEQIPAPAHVKQVVGDAREFFSELQV
ncbi:NAD-dependent protein deacylase [Weissella thailandensis]|uniref:protein acetyllysine N-acetyltransferase n=1 Tax=Weissella thailandensis TaxID=89061 RepID=A0ABX9I1U6_9LACO|nr:NAD-dependent protein deacylase [Weissella thailandensis]NKY91797.1 NAD-dependent protein deacylase [Weissella thailandensis]RDS58649.1 NAD-dependent protein deacylase [Weissella thailandensis]GEP75659.1 NAD-dependent protein deacylase [Weissella thailandensis]